jgi:cytochrome c-type biogenesis protein
MTPGLLGALGAGMLSFLAPCVLPLVIPYLGFLGGVTLRALPGGGHAAAVPDRGRVLLAAACFVLGFAAVFTLMGATATALSSLFGAWQDQLAMLAGAVLVLFGLHLSGLLRIGLLDRDTRFQTRDRPVGPGGAFVVGLAFAFGWTPCVGPVLAGILTLAAAEQSVAQGALLLFAYALGIGIPFLLAAAFVTPFLGFVARFRRHLRWVELASAALLVAAGLLLITGRFHEIGFWMLETWPALGRLG